MREHAQALLVALADEVASEDPEIVIKLVPADGDPSTFLECGAGYSRNGHRYNEKGKEQTYVCKGPKYLLNLSLDLGMIRIEFQRFELTCGAGRRQAATHGNTRRWRCSALPISRRG